MPQEQFPMEYMGLPIQMRGLKKQYWDSLIERLSKKLGGWKGQFLPPTLLNMVLSAIPLYFLSVFRLPMWVRKKIDKFLWARPGDDRKALSLVGWQMVCLRRDEGGLRILRLDAMSKALLTNGGGDWS